MVSLEKYLEENPERKEKYDLFTDEAKQLLTEAIKNIESLIERPIYRHCTVDGEKALFHRWIETENLILKSNTLLPADQLKVLRKECIKIGHIPNEFTTEKIKSIQALVEYEDGTVDMVAPKRIVFCNVPDPVQVVYVCDRQKCADCSYPNCTHTSDINHAENFFHNGRNYEEKE